MEILSRIVKFIGKFILLGIIFGLFNRWFIPYEMQDQFGHFMMGLVFVLLIILELWPMLKPSSTKE